MLELIPCCVKFGAAEHTSVRLIYVPGQIVEYLPVEVNPGAKKLKDLRVSSNRGFLEFVIGIASVGEYSTKEVRLGYLLDTEEWYLLLPSGKNMWLLVTGKSIKDIYYPVFYDYLCLRQTGKLSAAESKQKLDEQKWKDVVDAMNRTKVEYKSTEDLEEFISERRYVRRLETADASV